MLEKPTADIRRQFIQTGEDKVFYDVEPCGKLKGEYFGALSFLTAAHYPENVHDEPLRLNAV